VAQLADEHPADEYQVFHGARPLGGPDQVPGADVVAFGPSGEVEHRPYPVERVVDAVCGQQVDGHVLHTVARLPVVPAEHPDRLPGLPKQRNHL
jgi:hypothetical protein